MNIQEYEGARARARRRLQVLLSEYMHRMDRIEESPLLLTYNEVKALEMSQWRLAELESKEGRAREDVLQPVRALGRDGRPVREDVPSGCLGVGTLEEQALKVIRGVFEEAGYPSTVVERDIAVSRIAKALEAVSPSINSVSLIEVGKRQWSIFCDLTRVTLATLNGGEEA